MGFESTRRIRTWDGRDPCALYVADRVPAGRIVLPHEPWQLPPSLVLGLAGVQASLAKEAGAALDTGAGVGHQFDLPATVLGRLSQCDLLSTEKDTRLRLFLDGPPPKSLTRIPLRIDLPPGVTAHLQPPLTQQEIDEGCIRKPEIVGGYALYDRAGCRVGELLPGLWTDNKGATCRAEIQRDKDGWWLALPDWLQSQERQWPAMKNLYFGHDSSGASYMKLVDAFGAGLFASGRSTPGSDGSCTRMDFYSKYGGTAPRVLGIYGDSGTYPTTLLKQTGENTTSASGAWIPMDLASPLGVTAGTYYWQAIEDSGVLDFYIGYDSGSATHRPQTNVYSSTMPSPFPSPVYTSGVVLSIRTYYEAAAGGETHLLAAAASGRSSLASKLVYTAVLASAGGGRATSVANLARNLVLVGSAQGRASSTASLARTVVLTGSVSAASAASADLVRLRGLASSVQCSAQLTALVERTRGLAGSARGAASHTATLAGLLVLAGSARGQLKITALLRILRILGAPPPSAQAIISELVGIRARRRNVTPGTKMRRSKLSRN